jgi:hypothetical protein
MIRRLIHLLTKFQTFNLRNLLNLDTVSKSDPVCILYMQDSQNRLEWIEVDRTECIKNDLNPSWSKKFALQYKFEERQVIHQLFIFVVLGNYF